MSAIEYYHRPNGQIPSAEWLEKLEMHDRAVVKAKIQKLMDNGLELLHTNMMKPIKGDDGDFYELVAGDFRLATYFNRRKGIFFLLNGWMKKGRSQPRDIENGRQLLHEMLNQGAR